MTNKQTRRLALLRWYGARSSGFGYTLDAHGMAWAIGNDAFTGGDRDGAHGRAITEFRHLNAAGRIAACRAFLAAEARP